jgi:hypothetical protein
MICLPIIENFLSKTPPLAGGPCMTNRAEWSNERWIQCTGKPAPQPDNAEPPPDNAAPPERHVRGGPCMTNRADWSNDKWIQCTGKPAPQSDYAAPPPDQVRPLGGPCMTNPADWSNDKWIQCTGKPAPSTAEEDTTNYLLYGGIIVGIIAAVLVILYFTVLRKPASD